MERGGGGALGLGGVGGGMGGGVLGQPISVLPTPAFLVDLDAFYHNSLLMSRRMGAQGVGWWVRVGGHR